MEPYIGQIMAFAFNFAPQGWAQCNGQLLQIQQYSPLFALIGTTYGGDGRTTFALPDLRGRTMLGMGQGLGLSNYIWGQSGGVENVTLTANQIPEHVHKMMGSADGQTVSEVAGSSLGSGARGVTPANIYTSGATNQVEMASSTSPVGGSQSHSNLQPYICINYCIALEGIFPSRP